MEKSKLGRLLIGVAFVLPALIVIVLILYYHINAPMYDEWTIVSFYRKATERGLIITDLFGLQMNEHRIVVPATLQMLIWAMTGCNNVVILVLMQLMLFAGVLLILKYWKIRRLPTWLLLPVCVMMFSFKQGMMQFWGTCFLWACCTLFAMLSFYFYWQYGEADGKNIKLILSLLFGVLATFSAANGLLVWIAYAALFVFQTISEKKLRLQKDRVAVAVVGVSCWCAYFLGWNRANADLAAKSFASFAEVFLKMIGNPFFEVGEAQFSFLFGAAVASLLIVFGVYLLVQKKITKYRFSILILLFFLGSIAMVSYGRAGANDGSIIDGIATSGQYSLYPIWFLCGAYILVVEYFCTYTGIIPTSTLHDIEQPKQIHSMHKSVMLLTVALSIFLGLISFGKYGTAATYRKYTQADAYVLKHWEEVPDSLKEGYVYPILKGVDWDIETEVNWIESQRLFLFSQNHQYEYPFNDYVIAERNYDFTYPKTQLEKGEMFIDSINGQPPTNGITVAAGDGLSFFGWALDDAHMSSPSAVYIEVEGRYHLLKPVERADVAAAYECEAYAQSGFQGYVSTYGLGPGEYRANIIVISADGESYYSTPAVEFKIV